MKRLIDYAILIFCIVCACKLVRAENASPPLLEFRNNAGRAVVTVRNDKDVYHEKWEYRDGKLHILQPMEIVYEADSLRLGSSSFRIVDRVIPGIDPDTYDVGVTGIKTLYLPQSMFAKPEPQAEDPPKTICGKNDKFPAPNLDLVQVSCIDFTALRKVAPEVQWPAGPVTQVLIHAKRGDIVRVRVNDQEQFGNLLPYPDGHLVALLQFEGIQHTTVEVKVYTEAP